MKKNTSDSNNRGTQVEKRQQSSDSSRIYDNSTKKVPNEISLTSIETGDKKPKK